MLGVLAEGSRFFVGVENGFLLILDPIELGLVGVDGSEGLDTALLMAIACPNAVGVTNSHTSGVTTNMTLSASFCGWFCRRSRLRIPTMRPEAHSHVLAAKGPWPLADFIQEHIDSQGCCDSGNITKT